MQIRGSDRPPVVEYLTSRGGDLLLSTRPVRAAGLLLRARAMPHVPRSLAALQPAQTIRYPSTAPSGKTRLLADGTDQVSSLLRPGMQPERTMPRELSRREERRGTRKLMLWAMALAALLFIAATMFSVVYDSSNPAFRIPFLSSKPTSR
jgi:hypothetical protein